MSGIQGAMFIGGLGFVAGGATAAVEAGGAVDQLQEGFAAVRNAFVNDAQGTSFANGGTCGPVYGGGKNTHPP